MIPEVRSGDARLDGPPPDGDERDPPDGATCDGNCESIGKCEHCYRQAIAADECPFATEKSCGDIPQSGVGLGQSAGDRALCLALDTCLAMTGCWTGADGIWKCFCGDAAGVACVGPAANGVCKPQIMAATRAMDELQAGQMIMSKDVPSGFATQKYACYQALCLEECR